MRVCVMCNACVCLYACSRRSARSRRSASTCTCTLSGRCMAAVVHASGCCTRSISTCVFVSVCAVLHTLSPFVSPAPPRSKTVPSPQGSECLMLTLSPQPMPQQPSAAQSLFSASDSILTICLAHCSGLSLLAAATQLELVWHPDKLKIKENSKWDTVTFEQAEEGHSFTWLLLFSDRNYSSSPFCKLSR